MVDIAFSVGVGLIVLTKLYFFSNTPLWKALLLSFGASLSCLAIWVFFGVLCKWLSVKH